MKKKILCTICARKNSKGLKNKNLKKISNKPLVTITLEHAIKSKLFDNIVVSSDSKAIEKICKKKRVFFIDREKKLSGSYISKIDVIKDALKKSEKTYKQKYELIVDLDVTSPLRKISDIKKAINLFNKSKYHNLVSGSDSRKNPFFNQVFKKQNRISLVKNTKKRIVSRQLAPKVFDLNASIYIWKRYTLLNNKKLINKKTGIFKMKAERSIDIDDKLDFKIVKYIFENKLN